MPTVIVLITLPIVIIFVRIILMWDNNDGDYDHVDAGNPERAELGKKVFNTLAVPLLLKATFCLFQALNCFNYQLWDYPILEHLHL